MHHGSDSFQIFLKQSILRSSTLWKYTKEVKRFPNYLRGGGGKIGNAQKTKDLFLFSGMASLMNAGLLHGSVCVIDMYNFLLAEVASPCSYINLYKGLYQRSLISLFKIILQASSPSHVSMSIRMA